MKYIEQHIAQVEIIFKHYQGQEPLHLYLKKYFKSQKKFGSRDRRNISECLYGVFRMGRENRHLSIRDRVYFFLFLKGSLPFDFFKANFDALSSLYSHSFEDKLEWLQENYELRKTFRTQEEISGQIDMILYRQSFYKEPNVFIRLRNKSRVKYESAVLEQEGQFITDEIVSFPPKVKLESIFDEMDYVVQDLNSQLTAGLFPVLGEESAVWDCCAGSGGKSILALDHYGNIDLTVTDIRASILRNLIKRFDLYDLDAEVIMEANVNKEKDLIMLEDKKFDFIICDAPCTGSGTWARNPEQCYYFEKKEVDKFNRRQRSILENVSKYLKPNGQLLYITCSVFSKENEEVVASFLEENKSFSKAQEVYLDGTTKRADTLFACSLIRQEDKA